ncbi:hypothetical protein CesoFtcFv8_002662 [Champsocephalus esox]|uniref:Uncharacterized protein n=2 Tax=Champsocephalus TaxID=52236 RepID=A0AAN8E3Y7_CHAGU|nr:hypothetical protein CesoFtcFv8_002662 [Champsocephalus esox]KAK5934325.1 hypothetical protein CgunFtcFv8_014732 [Champsocephalus gunnari]
MISSHGWPRTSSDTSCPQGAVDVGASETSPWRRQSPRRDLLSLPSASLPSSAFFLPFHLQSIAGSKPLTSGSMVNRGGRLQRERERIWEKAE